MSWSENGCATLLHDPRHILLFAYRPPDQSPTHFFESLHTLLATASSESTTLSVFGDLNAKHSSWQSDGSCNTAGNKFFELLLDFGLTQCVHSPTRFSSDGHSCSVIDIREVLHSVRRNFLDGMLRSGCEFRKLIPKRSLKRSIETESERNSVDHFRKSHRLVQR